MSGGAVHRAISSRLRSAAVARRAALGALAAACAVSAGLSPTHAGTPSGPAQSPGGAGSAAITTVLHPGWNLVAWLGPDTPTRELFDEIPALRQVSAWDGSEQAYVHALPDRDAALQTLTTGTGLWLRLGGDASVEWRRGVAATDVLLSLREGRNLAGWTAGDATPVAEALAPLGASVLSVHGWDARAQRFRRYAPSASGPAVLDRGDAVLIELSGSARWWQRGAAPPRITFLGEIPDSTREEIVAAYWHVREVIATRFGALVPGLQHYIGATVDDIRVIHREVFGPETRPGCVRTRRPFNVHVVGCVRHPMISAYVADLLHPLRPAWLESGARSYLRQALRTGADWYPPTHEDFVADENHDARRAAFPLRYFEPSENRPLRIQVAGSALGFFAVERLTERAGDPALFEYLTLMRDTSDWRAAFEAAFGIAVDDFYAEFARYRAEALPPFAHLVDDRREPVLAVLEGVPPEAADALRAEFADVQPFFADRFEAAATEFTLYVAPEPAAILDAFPGWHPPGSCLPVPVWGFAAATLRDCGDSIPFARAYTRAIVDELAHTLPPGGSVSGRAPRWYDDGVIAYAETVYGESTGALTAGDFHRIAAPAAVFSPASLRDVSTPEVAGAAGWWPSRALGYLAVVWLADHAGDPAIFDYYRRLPDAGSHDEAFEGAFGLTFAEFYEEFEAFRATLRAE